MRRAAGIICLISVVLIVVACAIPFSHTAQEIRGQGYIISILIGIFLASFINGLLGP